jgi:hypothetical protein
MCGGCDETCGLASPPIEVSCHFQTRNIFHRTWVNRRSSWSRCPNLYLPCLTRQAGVGRPGLGGPTPLRPNYHLSAREKNHAVQSKRPSKLAPAGPKHPGLWTPEISYGYDGPHGNREPHPASTGQPDQNLRGRCVRISCYPPGRSRFPSHPRRKLATNRLSTAPCRVSSREHKRVFYIRDGLSWSERFNLTK